MPAAPRRRAKEINDRVTALGQQFDKNIRDANVQLAFTTDELRGVPPMQWRHARRDEQGRVLLGIDAPTYLAVLQNASDAKTRERMWHAKTSEGGAPNLKLLTEIGTLRKEYASLFGAPSYADFTLRRRMARSAGEAQAFLDARPGWVAEPLAFGTGTVRGPGVRLTPLSHSTDGFFVARMVRP